MSSANINSNGFLRVINCIIGPILNRQRLIVFDPGDLVTKWSRRQSVGNFSKSSAFIYAEKMQWFFFTCTFSVEIWKVTWSRLFTPCLLSSCACATLLWRHLLVLNVIVTVLINNSLDPTSLANFWALAYEACMWEFYGQYMILHVQVSWACTASNKSPK